MKKAINYGYIQETPGRDIRMKKAFPAGYRYLFSAHEDDTEFRNPNMYTVDIDTHLQLDEFMQSTIENIGIMIGYKGIGKSTVLKNYFRYSQLGCIFGKERLIIPVFDWEPYLRNDICEACLLFHSVNKQILKKYPTVKATIREDDESTFEYEVRSTKEYLRETGIKEVLLLFDNIEQLPCNPNNLRQFIKAYKYLKTPIHEEVPLSYRLKILISSTPERFVWAMENGELGRYQHSDLFYIYKNNSINLHSYLSKKRRQPESPLKNIPEWDNVLNAFGEISRKFNHKYDAIIRGVSNYSVPDSLAAYADILSNERWIHPKTGGSVFRIEDMTLNNITVLRSLFCLENEMITGIHSKRFCNFLSANNEYDNSMIILLTVKLCYQQCCVKQIASITTPRNKSNSAENLYGERWHLKKCEILLIWKEIFGSVNNKNFPKFEEQVNESVDYLYNNGILAKCCKAKKGEPHEISNEARLYLTPKGKLLWEMLSQDSVLLEMFREDYVRIYEQDIEAHSHSPYSSQAHITNGNQFELFIDLCTMIMDLAKIEYTLREISVERRTYTAYKNDFGEDSVVAHLYMGLIKSISYSGVNITDGPLRDKITGLEEQIETLKDIFRWAEK